MTALPILSMVLPIFICTLIGFFWVRGGQPLDAKTLTSFVWYIGFPALLLSSFERPGLTLALIAQTFIAGVLAVVCFACIGVLALKALRAEVRPYLPALMLPNTGNLGIPIAYSVYGADGLVFAVVFSTLIKVAHATIGVWLASGSMSFRALIWNPMFYALALALLMVGTGANLPAPLLATAKLLGGAALPLMLIMLGASLAHLQLGSVARSLILSLVRVGGGLSIGIAIATVLGLTPIAAGTFALQCAMPVAVLTHMLADKYGGPSEEIAGMILVSTGLVVVGLPLIMAVVT
jgi:predicted permease